MTGLSELSRKRRTAILRRIAEEIRCHDSYLVGSHVNPEGDAIGSILALGLVLKGLGKRVQVLNQDPTPEEFESYTLNREKIVAGNGRIVLFVGPLEPGRYEFFGEFNMATARGWLVAK